MSASPACPRCGARCVVGTRDLVECLACGETLREPTNPLTSPGLWDRTAAPRRAADRGRHFEDEEAV